MAAPYAKITIRNNPAGNVRIGDYNYLAPSNTTIKEIKDFGDIPLYKNGVQTVFMKDVATVEDGADITTSYALVNGKRSVYLPITKSADASTWEVVQKLKESHPAFVHTIARGMLSFLTCSTLNQSM